MLELIELDDLKDIAKRAGEEILSVYGSEFSVDVKEDKSPLTEADRRSNAIIVESLKALYPDIPIISEENPAEDFQIRKDWDYFWLIDPLDGTKEFIKRNGEFTVNIALIHRDTPVIGIVYQPVGQNLYWSKAGESAWKSVSEGIPVQLEGGDHYLEKDEIRVVASRSHLTDEVKEFVEGLRAGGKKVHFLSAGSSLKICLVAEGKADVYPRLGPTMEWDTGAAHAIAVEAGRSIVRHDSGQPLQYNKENLLNPYFIVE